MLPSLWTNPDKFDSECQKSTFLNYNIKSKLQCEQYSIAMMSAATSIYFLAIIF
jgi:hypothetical protein